MSRLLQTVDVSHNSEMHMLMWPNGQSQSEWETDSSQVMERYPNSAVGSVARKKSYRQKGTRATHAITSCASGWTQNRTPSSQYMWRTTVQQNSNLTAKSRVYTRFLQESPTTSFTSPINYEWVETKHTGPTAKAWTAYLVPVTW